MTFTVLTVLNTSLISLQPWKILGRRGLSSELWRCRSKSNSGVEGALANRSDWVHCREDSPIMASPRGIPQPCQFQVRHQTPGDPRKWRRLAGEARPLTHLTKEKKPASPKISPPANLSRKEEPVKRITGNDARRTCFARGWRQAFETRGHGLAPAQPLPSRVAKSPRWEENEKGAGRVPG